MSSINNPKNIFIETCFCFDCFSFDCWMLKLNYQTTWCFNFWYVLFAIFSKMHNLLPLNWKLVFPIPMPFSFVFPPVIVLPFRLMRPMPDFSISTFSNHFNTTAWTITNRLGGCFNSLIFSERKFHYLTITRSEHICSSFATSLIAMCSHKDKRKCIWNIPILLIYLETNNKLNKIGGQRVHFKININNHFYIFLLFINI